MPTVNRRHFLKLAGVAPTAGLGAYELTRNARVPFLTGILGPTPAHAAPLPPGTRALDHQNVMQVMHRRLFPGMRSYALPTRVPANLLDFQPERVASMKGVLETDLVATFARPRVNGVDLNVRTYDSRLPGRTFVARPGDVLRFHLVNKFPQTAGDFAQPPNENMPLTAQQICCIMLE